MANLKLPEGDPLLDVIKELAKRACLLVEFRVVTFTDGEDTWREVIVTFTKNKNCPKEGREEPFSETLQELLLDIGRIGRRYIDVTSTPEDEETGSGGNLGLCTIHIDKRRNLDDAFGPGSFLWQLIHELAHYFHAPFPRSNEENDENDENETEEQEITTTNDIRRELGEDCYRYPDHGVEVFICPDPPDGLKAVEIGKDGKVKREAPIILWVDPNPAVPFTGGGHLAGPGTY